MRLRTSHPLSPTALAPTALALFVTFTPAPAHALEPRPDCVSSDTHDFPIKTRIHGGPDTYQAGGDSGTWYIDLTNTTAHPCGAIHPVVVLVDEKRTLRPEQARLEFYEGERAHAVRFERSDEAENVGPFDDGFHGFTVAPGRTLTVKVRLSLASGASAPNSVVANAAVVQKHDDDGDWVGESNAYRFRIEGAVRDKAPESGEDTGTGEDQDGTADTGADAGLSPGTGTTGTGEARTDTGSGTTAGTGTTAPSVDRLASTGPGGANRPVLAALALVLVAFGAGLFALARRMRPRRR
ncbi:hypothetical protein [Streptomyces sp. NBC_00151]|uniref:hypothetical protein n=1 Tax=Streptomyces sp. NBC_00151 TaxID=2975669 RepID=UPI002DDC2CC1|nr:hypothetical protein [Streptomyces sp. NBC_00151]WRZ41556.1 hypothetical protein OG915_28060 [Streptomyces sp. NBC_00151]